jgi:hypothetical protein
LSLTALLGGFLWWFLSVLDGARRGGQNDRHAAHDASEIKGQSITSWTGAIAKRTFL